MVLNSFLDASSTTKPDPDKAFKFEVHMIESSGVPYIPEKATVRRLMRSFNNTC